MPGRPKKRRRLYPPATRAYTEREVRSLHRTAARNPGMSRVLATPELLECVLLHLDMRTLLVSAQRACRAWHELIGTSAALQEALFFKPEDLGGGGSAKTRRERGQGDDIATPADDEKQKKKKSVVVRKNPLLASVFPAWFEDYTQPPDHATSPGAVLSSVSRVPARHEFASQPFAAAADRVLRHRRASWRRMLVQQPPARHVGEWRLVDYSIAVGHDASMRSYAAGLRMGRLYDATSEAVGWASERMVADVVQCVLWGPGGVRRLKEGYPAPEPRWASRKAGLDLAVCAPCEVECKEILDGLAAAADVTILVHDNGLYYPRQEEQVDEFCLKFICGAHNHQYIGKSWQEQPKGKELWKWEKSIGDL